MKTLALIPALQGRNMAARGTAPGSPLQKISQALKGRHNLPSVTHRFPHANYSALSRLPKPNASPDSTSANSQHWANCKSLSYTKPSPDNCKMKTLALIPALQGRNMAARGAAPGCPLQKTSQALKGRHDLPSVAHRFRPRHGSREKPTRQLFAPLSAGESRML